MSNMSTLQIAEGRDPAELDRLVPPLPTLGRRILVAVVVLVAAVGVAWLLVVGRLVPELEVGGQTFSTVADERPVELLVGLTNGGQRDLELRSAVVTIDGVAVPGIGVRIVSEPGTMVQELAAVAPFVLPAHSRAELIAMVVPAVCGSADESDSAAFSIDADVEVNYGFSGFPAFERTSRVIDAFAGSSIVCAAD